MTEFTLKVTLENDESCRGCLIINECFMCTGGCRPSDCPLQPIVERKCETCKYSFDVVCGICIDNKLWEQKE